jgi:hypothetical protein
MDPANLERTSDRQLKQLPALRAPETLLPRIMAAVHAWAERPWYARGWFAWPLAWQIAGIAAMVAIASGALAGVVVVRDVAWGPRSTRGAEAFGRAAGAVAGAQTLGAAARILWHVTIQPLLPYAFAVVVLMCAACGLLGAALTRVVPGRI